MGDVETQPLDDYLTVHLCWLNKLCMASTLDLGKVGNHKPDCVSSRSLQML